MAKFNHAVSIAFEVISTQEGQPTADEIMVAMVKKVNYYRKNPTELNSVEVFDTFEVED